MVHLDTATIAGSRQTGAPTSSRLSVTRNPKDPPVATSDVADWKSALRRRCRDAPRVICTTKLPCGARSNMHRLVLTMNRCLLLVLSLTLGAAAGGSAEVLRYHTLLLDEQNKIIPWFTPAANAFDNYLDQCWAWAVAAPNDANGLPISFLYCAWKPSDPPTNPPTADESWENDVGEKIPNWVESARLILPVLRGSRAARLREAARGLLAGARPDADEPRLAGFSRRHVQCGRHRVSRVHRCLGLVGLSRGSGGGHRLRHVSHVADLRGREIPRQSHPGRRSAGYQHRCRHRDRIALALRDQLGNRGEPVPLRGELGWRVATI